MAAGVTETLEKEAAPEEEVAKSVGLAETRRVEMEGKAAEVTTPEMKEEAAEAAKEAEEAESPGEVEAK